MDNYATEIKQELILTELKEINANFEESKIIIQNMNKGIYIIAFMLILSLVIEIVKKALYTK